MASTGARAVGVDFGTSTSLVAERDGPHRAEVVPLGRRTRFVPSVAAWRGGRIVVGEDADIRGADGVIRSIKRAITENRETIEVATETGRVAVQVDDVVLALLAEIAGRARDADLPLEEEPVVRLGCPAMWTGAQRRRLLDLAARAGIPVTHATLIDEPVAAGVAWLSHRYLAHRESPTGRVLVFDMGGGTLDIAVLDVAGGERPDVRVLAAIGLPEAGDDLDRRIVTDLELDLRSRGFDVDTGPRAAERRGELLRLARETKVALSAGLERTVALAADDFGGISTIAYTRDQLEACFESQMERAVQMVWAALRAARLTEQFAPTRVELPSVGSGQIRALGPDELGRDVSFVVLAGGMSRIPMVARRLAEMLPKAELHERVGDFLADEVVVAGLADTTGYDRISLHRPAFDFVLEWTQNRRKQRRVLYEAYTPLYDLVKIARGDSFLGHGWYGRYPDVPREGRGVVRVVFPTGESVGLHVDGEARDGIPVDFGSHPFSFKIYCGGEILISDGVGRRRSVRVQSWPVVRGHDYEAILRLIEAPEPPDPPVEYPFNVDDD